MNRPANLFYVQVMQLNEAKDFFNNLLGMNTEMTILAGREKCILVKPNSETSIFLSEKRHLNQTNKITLKSDDCLEDYCRLKANGVSFKKAPAYLDEGLCVEFSDPFGNDYTILEQRNYTED
jgi:predicted enzyme related to lactoylglutathione lyase